MADDYYKILEISKGATPDEIQKAYRKLARKHHPDMNPDDPKGAQQKFQKVQEAFDTLNNPEKRKFYDQFGVSPDQAGSGGGQGSQQWSFGAGNPGAGPFRGGGANFNFEDILSMFGGGMGGMGGASEDFFSGAAPRRPARGNDVNRNLTIPFTLAVEGGKVDMKFRRTQGKEESVSVKIPPGIVAGKKIRLAGLGHPGRDGGKPGDLMITIHVEDHPFFTRKDDNLYLRLPITLKEAVFGAKIDIPTVKGNVKLTVPAGSSSGTKLRVRGCGVPKPKTAKEPESTGDLFAELFIVLPKKWTDEEKQLLEKISSEPDKPLRNDLRW